MGAVYAFHTVQLHNRIIIINININFGIRMIITFIYQFIFRFTRNLNSSSNRVSTFCIVTTKRIIVCSFTQCFHHAVLLYKYIEL